MNLVTRRAFACMFVLSLTCVAPVVVSAKVSPSALVARVASGPLLAVTFPGIPQAQSDSSTSSSRRISGRGVVGLFKLAVLAIAAIGAGIAKMFGRRE